MNRFQYHRPKSLEEACRLMKAYGETGHVMSGGTDLLVQYRNKDAKFKDMKHLVDLGALKKLDYIIEKEGWIHIGALATHTTIKDSEVINEKAPLLSGGCNSIGSPQIRNMGTIGGGICNASPASDVVTPLIALNAKAVIQDSMGVKTVNIEELFEGPYQTNLKSGEILKEVMFPILSDGSQTVFEKLGRRKAMAISRMNMGVVATCNDEGSVTDIRIAPGCVFSVPSRVFASESILLAQKPTLELIEKASQKVAEEMIAKTGIRWSTRYKEPVVIAMTKRALCKGLGVSYNG